MAAEQRNITPGHTSVTVSGGAPPAPSFFFTITSGVGLAGDTKMDRRLDDGLGSETLDPLYDPTSGTVITPPDPCDEIGEKIDTLANGRRPSGSIGEKGLNQRIDQMARMRTDDQAFEGYLEQVEKRRTELRKWLKKWDDNDCGPTPPGVTNALEREVLSYDQWRARRIMNMIGVSVGTGYLTYRAIRLLPSLIPYLWWTLPGNVAAP